MNNIYLAIFRINNQLGDKCLGELVRSIQI